ncbi:MAG: hypothetical protein FJ118_03830 [Deltaproteobacteria bacterium]|nr:hypothetical protein [Deltaproteobacteria bacterium]
MKFRTSSVLIALVAIALIGLVGNAHASRTWYLALCQELVNNARAYEARADAHNRQAQGLMVQIEQMARLPKNQGTMSGMDKLFSMYDENRAMEAKYRQLYRKSTEEADKCMKGVE